MTTRMLLINVSAIRQLSGTDPNLDSTHIFTTFHKQYVYCNRKPKLTHVGPVSTWMGDRLRAGITSRILGM